jgi:transcriptional regulator with XRE-family HTH domain
MVTQSFLIPLAADLKGRRVKLGLTQSRLAALSGLSRATINGFESGTMDLGVAKVFRIAQILGLKIGVLETQSWSEGWLETAARSASVSYRTTLPAGVLAQSFRTGKIDPRYRSHVATFLDEASPATLVRAVAEAFSSGEVPKAAWRNVARMARATMSTRPELA